MLSDIRNTITRNMPGQTLPTPAGFPVHVAPAPGRARPGKLIILMPDTDSHPPTPTCLQPCGELRRVAQ